MRLGHTLKTALSGVVTIGLLSTVSEAGYYGRVIDKNNAPVQGVAVSLDVQKLTATTDALGKFTLGTVVSVEKDFNACSQRPVFAIVGSKLHFNMSPMPSQVVFRLYSMAGRLFGICTVEKGVQNESTADVTKMFSSTGDGCFVLQASFDNRSETVFCNRINGSLFTIEGDNGISIRSGASVARKKAAIKDTLNISKTAFLPNRFTIADTTASNLGDLKIYPAATGTLSNYYGFNRYDFKINQRNCIIVLPKTKPAPGNPWLWRTYFFDHKPYIDSILCTRGYYMGYIDMPNMYGCPNAVKDMDTLYNFLTTNFGLSKKPHLIGISRGGLYIYNWGRANTSRLSCVYGDGACYDIIAWPCACYPQGGTPSASDWTMCKNVYGFANDNIAKAYTGNPYQNMKPFADAKTPLINVYGTADPAAIPSLNVLRAQDSLKKYNWQSTLIAKPGIGHVHGVQASDGALPGQADTLLNFMLKNTSF
jgi:hypothetical protein